MADNSRGLLDLYEDCIAEIMKYIIADCELRFKSKGNQVKYDNLVSFALAHGKIMQVLQLYYKDLYQSLEFIIVARTRNLTINFEQLPSGKNSDSFWRLYADAVRENNVLVDLTVLFTPKSYDPEFLDHFQMIKRALENKRSLTRVQISLKGYSVESLSNFDNLSHLSLDARASAETLVNVCMSNPQLHYLHVMSNDIYGRLSDIAPHCSNLKQLEFVPKVDVDAAEYAPLAKLPKLEDMTINGVYQNGWLLPMLQAAEKWKRPRSQPLTLRFSETLPSSGTVTLARVHSMETLTYSCEEPPTGILLEASYNFFEISKDSCHLAETLATITLTKGLNFYLSRPRRELRLYEGRTSDIRELLILSKLFNVNIIRIFIYHGDIADLFRSIIVEGLTNLKSFNSNTGVINPSVAVDLVKINSIQYLVCSISDWESIEPLGELSNLQHLSISVQDEFSARPPQALSGLIRTCQMEAKVECTYWKIVFRKKDKTLEIVMKLGCEANLLIPLSQVGGIKRLGICGHNPGSLNELLEAFAGNLNVIEEVLFNLGRMRFEDIHKVTEVQTIKNLRLPLSDTNGIEKLSELTGLEELTIWHSERGSLDKLFDQLATMESPSLQSLQVKANDFSSEEVLKISRVKSLKNCHFTQFYGPVSDCESFTELAKSNIEELSISIYPPNSLQNVLTAFAKQRPHRLQALKVLGENLDRMELSLETSQLWNLESIYVFSLLELNSLVNLTISCEYVGYKFSLHTLKKVVIYSPIGLKECLQLAELEHLESLTVSLLYFEEINVLADIQNLNELIITDTKGSLSKIYQAFERKSDLKLKYLSVPIECVEELNEIGRLKSLNKLHLRFMKDLKTLPDLGQLTELKELCLDIELHEVNYVLAILTSCINLDLLTINYEIREEEYFLREVENHLKSIRDPTLRGPLRITLHKTDDLPNFHVEDVDEAYLKVYYVYGKTRINFFN